MKEMDFFYPEFLNFFSENFPENSTFSAVLDDYSSD